LINFTGLNIKLVIKSYKSIQRGIMKKMKKISILIIVIVLSINLFSQNIKDIDGNVYHAVNIDSLLWLQENLNVTRYNNGDSIQNITDEEQVAYLTAGGYVKYSDFIPHYDLYGKLYNYFAVKDKRGICPIGWRVPTPHEWEKFYFLYQKKNIAAVLKIKDTSFWDNKYVDTIDLGFNALPAGYRFFYQKKIRFIGSTGAWWSLINHNPDASVFFIDNANNNFRSEFKSASCFSVRCVQSLPEEIDTNNYSIKDSLTSEFVFAKKEDDYYQIWGKNKDSLLFSGFGVSTHKGKNDSLPEIVGITNDKKGNYVSIYFHNNGAIDSYYYCVNDSIRYSYVFYKNGNLRFQDYEYFKGSRTLSIQYKEYYLNGMLKSVKNYGIYTIKKGDRFDKKPPFEEGDGLIENKYNLLNGSQYEYNESGKMIGEKIYTDGVLIDTKTY